jgi:hypothetical protein
LIFGQKNINVQVVDSKKSEGMLLMQRILVEYRL